MRASLIAPALIAAASARFVMYADEWHPTRPNNPADRAGIDHVVLAFAMANATASFQPKVPVSTIRSEFPNAKVMIAVGGWGDDMGFFQASKTDASMKQFAADVATMLTNTAADGVDIDWEYPGGNGGDYRQVPNSSKAYQIDAFPKFLAALRAAIGHKLLSIAVPGKKGDMIAFTKANGPKIWPSVDYINVMSYDLMNRRDTVTNHHSSVADSIQTIENYLAIGAPPQKINLGFSYYAKYFTTQGDCSAHPLGCPIVPAEDPVTGKDTLTSGAWTFETSHMKAVDGSSLPFSNDGTCGPEKGTRCSTGCCSQYGNCGTSPEHCSGACQHAFGTGCTDADVAGSWQNAMAHGVTDKRLGGQYYFDAANRLFWTWDTPALISQKFDQIVRKYKLGGVMAWSLGEDSYDWSHIKTMASELAKDGQVGAGADTADTTTPPQQDSSDASIPAPDPELSPASAPVALVPTPTPSKDPVNVVWVDGTPQGPATDLVTLPGSPADFTVPVPAEEASTPQQKQTLSQPAPLPVQPVTPQPSTTSADLPYSPEFLALMKSTTRRNSVMKRVVRKRSVPVDLDHLKDLADMMDMVDSGDIKDLGDDVEDSADSDDSKDSGDSKDLGDMKDLSDVQDWADIKQLGEVYGTGWIWALKRRVRALMG